jgi:hypothetical protein
MTVGLWRRWRDWGGKRSGSRRRRRRRRRRGERREGRRQMIRVVKSRLSFGCGVTRLAGQRKS